MGLLGFTLATALLSVLFAWPLGVLAGALLAHRRGPVAALVETLCSLPMVLPPTAIGIAILALFSVDGPLGFIELLLTWKAVVLAGAVMGFPFVVRAAKPAFESIDPRLAPLARTLGATRTQAFWRVTLPLASRGLISGAVLAFARALGEFGATILVAGNIEGRTQTLSLKMFQLVQSGEDVDALKLAGVSMVLALIAVGVAQWVDRK